MFGENIIKKRKELNMSRYRLREKSGLSYFTLSQAEKSNNMYVETLQKIANALDVELWELFK